MTGIELLQILERMEKVKINQESHPQRLIRTPECIDIPRLEEGAQKTNWTVTEQRHLDTCTVCQRLLEINDMLEAQVGEEEAVFGTDTRRKVEMHL